MARPRIGFEFEPITTESDEASPAGEAPPFLLLDNFEERLLADWGMDRKQFTV